MSIQEHLNKIRNAVYGHEVRESIAKGIETAYDDASEKDNANMEVKIARGTHPNLRSRLEEVDDKQQQNTAQLQQTEQELNAQLAQKDDKIDGVNLRVDNLVIPLSPENTNLEVTDAHVSVTKNKTFPTLTHRLESAEKRDVQLESMIVKDVFHLTEWEQGSISDSGQPITSTIRARSGFFEAWEGMILTAPDTAINGAYIFYYDVSGNFIKTVMYTRRHLVNQKGLLRIVSGFTDDRLVSDPRYFEGKIKIDLNTDDKNTLYGALVEGRYYVNTWQLGSVAPTGETTPADNRAVSGFIKVKKGMVVGLDGSALAGIYLAKYDTNKTYQSNVSYQNDHIIDYDGFARFVVRYSDNRNISDLDALVNQVYVRGSSSQPSESESDEIPINNWSIGTISGIGEPFDQNNRVRSNFVKLPKNSLIYGENLTGLKGIYLIQYDENKNYVDQFPYSQSHTTRIEGWVRLVTAYTDDRAITSTDFMKDRIVAKKQTGPHNYLFGNFSDYYNSPDMVSMTTTDAFNLRASTIADVYAGYDEQMASFTAIMTKQRLGYGGDSNNVADTNLPIYEYTINALKGRNNLQVGAPTILIMTGIHGDEKSTVWSTLQFVKQLLNDWHSHDNLESILSNVTLKIIPVLNPGGYNANTRTNRRGVDLNRNFSYKWAEFDDSSYAGYYKGVAPYSELESQLLRDWLIVNKQALAFIDYHNVFSASVISYIDTPNVNLHKIYSSQIRRMSNKWFRRYGNIAEATPGQSQGNIVIDEQPMTFQEGIIRGIKNSTIIEVARDFNGVEFTSEVIERGVEVIANYLLGLLDAYAKNLIS